MFDIGWSELLIIGIVALIAIGPKELPAVLRTVGQYMTKIRRMASEFQGQFQDAMREAEMADLKKEFDEVSETASDLTNYDPMADFQKDFDEALEGKSQEPAAGEADKPADSAATASQAGSGEPAETAAAATTQADTEVAIAPEPRPEPEPNPEPEPEPKSASGSGGGA
jgi:sec-independent protein translocase protein TatB